MPTPAQTNRPEVLAPAVEVAWRFVVAGWMHLMGGVMFIGFGVAFLTATGSWSRRPGEWVFSALLAAPGLFLLGRLAWRAGRPGWAAWQGRMIEAKVVDIVRDPRGSYKASRALEYLWIHPETKLKHRGLGPVRTRELSKGVWHVGDTIIVAYLPGRPEWSAILSREPWRRVHGNRVF